MIYNIKKENQFLIEEIAYHDAEVGEIGYNNIDKKMNFSLDNSAYGYRYKIEFKEVIYHEIIALDLWGISGREYMECWYIDDEITCDEKLLNLQKKINVENLSKNIPINMKSPLNNAMIDEYIKSVLSFANGDYIRVICKEIIIQELKM